MELPELAKAQTAENKDRQIIKELPTSTLASSSSLPGYGDETGHHLELRFAREKKNGDYY